MATSPAPDAAAPPGMCPGIAVLGGGGAGGNGDGNGNGNGGGNDGDGNGNGDGGDGDGKGSGSCGGGGASGCPNCAHQVAAGDPVDALSGTVFTVPKTDLLLPGLFALDIRRSYSSARRDVDIGLGFGWVHSLAWSLEEQGGEVVVRTGDGRRLELPRPASSQMLSRGAWGVFRGEGFYAVRPGNPFEHYFEPVEPGSKRHHLRFVKYRNRGTVSLQYERGRLARAVDTVGRVILFENDAQGRLSSISVPDPRARTVVFARFAYDSDGNLVASTDADGHVTAFAYDDQHRLTRLEYPSGLVFRYVYDRRDRCIETWGEYPGRVDPALDPNAPKVLRDRTRAKGIYHCRFEYSDTNDYSEVIDSVRLRRYFAGPNGVMAKSVNSLGGVTSRTFDELGRVTAQIDAVGGTWTYEYDEFDGLALETDPEGAVVRVARDGAGDEIEVVDAAGGVTAIARDAHGEITSVRDAAGGVLQLRLRPTGLVQEAVDTRGGRHLYDWDDHGNCIARTFPTGARYQFEYDFWGRLVREIDPAGGITQNAYDFRGHLIACIDPLGRTTSYQYDGMGNLVAETRPDGATTFRDYGGLNWLWRVRHPDGTELRAAHNREGWPEYFENERGERHSFRHDNEGLITWERNFYGQEYQFEHDLMGRVIAYRDSLGRREMTRSPTGRLVREKAPDGSLREYRYNARGELVAATSGPEVLEVARDPLGRVLRESFEVDGRRYTVDSERTASGDRVGYRTSVGLDMLVRRDPVGRVAELWNGGQRVLGIGRSVLGQPIRRELPNGGLVVDTYDLGRRLRRREIVGPEASAGPAGQPEWIGTARPGIEERFYDYTPIDEVQRVSTTDGGLVELEYDVRRRLRRVRRARGVEEYSVDAVGNYQPSGSDAPPMTFGPGSQLTRGADTQYRYDDRGQLVEKCRAVPGAKPELTRYRWDAWGLLRRVDLPDGRAVELAYDAFARRLGKRVLRDGKVIEKHHYVWDQLALVHDVEVDAAENTVGIQSFLFEDNDDSVPLGHWDGRQWLHYINDVNGTPEAILDGAGRVVGRLERATFGRTRTAPGSKATTPFRFPGQLEDAETGLHYNRYRYYDPDAGRYISPDPIGLDGGFNLYAYGPNPIGWADPMGWVHAMQVRTADNGFLSFAKNAQNRTEGSAGYVSGWADGNPCPPHGPDDPYNLKNRANCHTEQKFAADLIAHNKDVGKGQPGAHLAGRSYGLSGNMPPCPTCHNALRKAAADTGADIEYSWGQPAGANTIKYSGKSDPVFAGGQAAQLGAGGYNDWRPDAKRTWESSSRASAHAAYHNACKSG